MTAKTIVVKLQRINALVAGVRSAPTEMPGALRTEMLPCVLVYPLAATHAVPFYEGRRTERQYLVRVYVAPIGQGEGVDEGFQACLPFLDGFAVAYHTVVNIAVGTGEWEELTLVEDTGVRADMTLHGSGQGQVYWGIEFTVQIKEKESVS